MTTEEKRVYDALLQCFEENNENGIVTIPAELCETVLDCLHTVSKKVGMLHCAIYDNYEVTYQYGDYVYMKSSCSNKARIRRPIIDRNVWHNWDEWEVEPMKSREEFAEWCMKNGPISYQRTD